MHHSQWKSYEQGVEVLEGRGVESTLARVQAGRLRPDLHLAWLARVNPGMEAKTRQAMAEDRPIHAAVPRQVDQAKAATTAVVKTEPKRTPVLPSLPPTRQAKTEAAVPTVSVTVPVAIGSGRWGHMDRWQRNHLIEKLRQENVAKGMNADDAVDAIDLSHPGLRSALV